MDNVNMKNVKVCLYVGKKKQEFNSAFLKVNNLKCESYHNKFLKDKESVLVVKNEF